MSEFDWTVVLVAALAWLFGVGCGAYLTHGGAK